MMPLNNNSVHVWHTTLDLHDKRCRTFWCWLSAAEKARAEKLKLPYRQRFILTHGLLRKLLSVYSEQPPEKIHFSYTPLGKPLFLNPSMKKQIEFSLSHSKNMAALAFTLDTPIGIDLELKIFRNNIDKIAYRFLSSDDCERLKKLNGEKKLHAFFNAWVKLEASIKAFGHSLKTHPLSQYASDANRKKMVSDKNILCKKKYPYSLCTLTLHPNFAAALAVKGSIKAIVTKELD